MATAEASTVKVEVVRVEESPSFTLTLSPEEASLLVDIGMKTGGYPADSRRGLMDGIRDALRDAGALASTSSDFEYHPGNGLRFGSR